LGHGTRKEPSFLTKIREATEEDVFDILVLAREFSKESPVTHKWDKEKTEHFIISAINNNNTIIFILEDKDEIVGAIVGIINEMYMSQTVVATEMAWFVSKDYRGRKGSIMLMKTFEKWAETNGANYICMGAIEGITELDKLYTKSGYFKSETLYMRNI
jgi:RimJ/RimL family protein N-acetyltransferase